MKKVSIALFAALSLSILVAPANAREFADIYTDCGLGAMIAPNNDAVAAVTNVTWDLGTTAISSNATSPDTCAGGGATSAAIIFDAYPSIEKDLAIGSGEHLTALLTVAGVASDEQAELGQKLRVHLAKLAAADDYSEQTRFQKAENLFNALFAEIA